MTQADRDRLVTLKKAKKKLITQGDAAEELGVSRRHVKRLLKAWSGVRSILQTAGWHDTPAGIDQDCSGPDCHTCKPPAFG